MRITTIILIIAMFSIALRGNEGDSKAPISLIPPEAQSVIDKATADQAVIDKEADAKRVKVLTAMVDKLKTAQEKATKAGKLEASLAVRAEIAKAQGVLDDIEARKPKIAAALVDAMDGRWNVTMDRGYSSPWTFTSKGKTIVSKDNHGTYTSKGNTILISWVNGLNESFTVNAEISAGTGTDFGGMPLRVVRQ